MVVSIAGYSTKRHIRSFSLVELLVVILIIGSLMALGVGGYTIAQKKLAETRTRATMEKIKLALEAYKNKHGYYIQEYGAISGKYYFRLDKVSLVGVAAADIDKAKNNISKIISYKDTPLYDPAGYDNGLPKGNAFVLDSYPGKPSDVERRIQYTCPATDAPFELRSSGHDRIFGDENGNATEREAAKDDIVVR
jgi:type II secretory pathway pseudopilin PulG